MGVIYVDCTVNPNHLPINDCETVDTTYIPAYYPNSQTNAY